jgi:hypothetical protein
VGLGVNDSAALQQGRWIIRLHVCSFEVNLDAMARAALRLRLKTSALASWLPHWPTCMCEISREDSIGFDSKTFPR